jgi:hypothetical protein
MSADRNEETPHEKALRKENERWKEYASALLIAMPVLLGGLALSDQKSGYSIASGFACLVGIVLVVLWYGRDNNYSKGTPGRRYPTLLFYASCCFGFQAACLAVAFMNLHF